jgi:signal transduction histidine kinase
MRLAELGRVRTGVQAGWLRAQAAFDAYTTTIDDLEALLPLPANVGGDARLGQSVRAFVNLSRAKELAAQIRGRLFAVCTATRFEPGEFEIVADMRAQRLAAFDRFRVDAGPPEVARFDEAVSGQAVRNASRLEQSVVDNATAPDVSVDAQQWWQASTTELELMRSVEVQLLDAAANGAATRSAQQWRSTVLGSSLSLLLLGFATLTSLVIGRSMADSLRGLRQQALDVAQRRLPQVLEQLRAAPRGLPAIEVERLAVRTADEVGEVAEAFTAVHRSAVRLAAEQALMRQNVNDIFVNLARRSQTLVERQLQLLDGLEASETDPAQLENLFRLDHLATRMRRNDENLLVLAGGDSTRRWTEPVPLGAVALAATAEIEQYARVRHDITDDVYIAGHAVADLVHLVAELLENATIFSPPDTPVTVLGWAGADGGAVLVIQDEGMGMSADLVAHANQQLASPVSLDVAAAERMGLVVIGHLADRHGIRVEIRSQGTTLATGGVGAAAIVVLPARILAAATTKALPWSGAPARWLTQDRDATAAEPDRLEAAAPARRAVPTRAEDVLGKARSRDDGSVWWSKPSRTAAAHRPSKPVAPAAPAPPVNGAVNHAGLPIRVPMAHLPELQVVAASRHVITEPDPVEVGSVLTQFYGGVHRAASEDDQEASG